MLVYPDGTLQEAGGYVWRDGTGANAGRNSDPAAPGFNLRRDVDYVSGAAILLPKAVWQDVGGFDDRYAPAYYEDTDLAMRLRNLGWRVLYEPASKVVHFEGISSGTSLESGIKAYQVVNREKFLKKWGFALQAHHTPQNITHSHLPRLRRPRLLFIDHIVPEPDHDAGSVIAWSYLKILSQLGYEITFIPCNLRENGHYGSALRSLGVQLLHHPYVSDVGVYLKEHAEEFDAFFLWRVNAGGIYTELIRELCPEVPIIFHTQDLHFLRMLRAAQHKGDDEGLLNEARSMRDRELRVMDLATETILVSLHEERYLREQGCKARLSVIPLVLDLAPGMPWS